MDSNDDGAYSDPELVALLQDPSLWEEPSAQLEDRVAGGIAEERRVVVPMKRRNPWPARFAAAAVGAAAAVAVVLVVTRDQEHADASVAVTGTDLAPGISGNADITTVDSGVRINFSVPGLPRRDGQEFYEGWLKNCAGTALVPDWHLPRPRGRHRLGGRRRRRLPAADGDARGGGRAEGSGPGFVGRGRRQRGDEGLPGDVAVSSTARSAFRRTCRGSSRSGSSLLAAASSTTTVTCGCSWIADAGHIDVTGPSTALAIASAFAVPDCDQQQVSCVQDGADPLRHDMAGHLVGVVEEPGVVAAGLVVRVLTRVREASDEVGSLKPTWPSAPMPSSCRSIPPASADAPLVFVARGDDLGGCPVGHVHIRGSMSTSPVKCCSMKTRYDAGWPGGRPMYSSSRNAVALAERQRRRLRTGGPARRRRRAASCRWPARAQRSVSPRPAGRRCRRRTRQRRRDSAGSRPPRRLSPPCSDAADRTRRARRRPLPRRWSASSSSTRSAVRPGSNRPSSGRWASRAGVADAASRRFRERTSGERHDVAHRFIESQHAAGEHALCGPHAGLVDDDLGVADRSTRRSPCPTRRRHPTPERCDRAEGAPCQAHHRPIDVQAVDDQAGDQCRVGQCCAGGPGFARAHRRHRVEQVGHAAESDRDRRVEFVIVGLGVPGAHGDTVRDELLDHVERARQLRCERDHRDPVIALPIACLVDGWRAQAMRRVGSGLRGFRNGPSRWTPRERAAGRPSCDH